MLYHGHYASLIGGLLIDLKQEPVTRQGNIVNPKYK